MLPSFSPSELEIEKCRENKLDLKKKMTNFKRPIFDTIKNFKNKIKVFLLLLPIYYYPLL